MPKLHEEATMEGEICGTLQTKGWLYDYGADIDYDRQRALYAPDLIAWVQQTQPEVWETLEKRHGEDGTKDKLLDRVRKVLDEKGTLATLRSGMEMVGIRRTIRLAQFKPASGLNPEITNRYSANRLRVVQQVRYRLDSEHSIDLVLFALATPAAAQTLAEGVSVDRHDGAAFDLVGLRLGMTADEARAALMKSGFSFSERGSWGHRGYDGLVRSEANRLRQPVPELLPTIGPEEISGEDAAGNRIIVRFTAMRDGPMVSEVVLRFNRNTAQIETLREDIFARYGEPSAANAYGDDYRWCLYLR